MTNTINTNTNTTDTNATKIVTYLTNRIREVETIDQATNEHKTTIKAVNLRASDFDAKKEWQGYKRKAAELAAAVHAYDTATTDEQKAATKKAAIASLQGIYNYFKNVAGVKPLTAQRVDLKYIQRLQAGRKLNKTACQIEVTQKSLAAFMGLIEDCLYFRITGVPFPKFNQSKTVAAENEKAKAEAAKAAEQNAKPGKTISAKSNRPVKAAKAVA